jgi:hypothetical protein
MIALSETLRRRKGALPAVLIASAALVYFVLLLSRNSWFAGGPDSSGYCNGAKLIASGNVIYENRLIHLLGLPPSMIYIFTPLGFDAGLKPYTMVPAYPAGVSMHQALFAKLGGWARGPYLIGPLTCVLALLATIGVGRELGLTLVDAVGAAAILGALPVVLFHAIQPVSDVPAMFYVALTIYLALRAPQNIRFAVLAGVAFSVAVWVRPTNFLAAVPLAFAFRWRWRPLLAAVAGSLPLGVALAIWQNVLYGSPLRTGYGSIRDVLERRPVCAVPQALALMEILTPVVVVGTLLGFLVPGDAWRRALLISWCGIFMLFYSFYGYCEGWMSTRFFLPAAPAIVISFLLAVRAVGRIVTARWPRLEESIGVLAVVLVVVTLVRHDRKMDILSISEIEKVYPTTIRFAEQRLPHDAIVATGLMSGAFFFDSGRETVRWDEVVRAGRLPTVRAAAARRHLRWYAVLSTEDAHEAEFQAWLPSLWVPVGMNRDVTLWQLQE